MRLLPNLSGKPRPLKERVKSIEVLELQTTAELAAETHIPEGLTVGLDQGNGESVGELSIATIDENGETGEFVPIGTAGGLMMEDLDRLTRELPLTYEIPRYSVLLENRPNTAIDYDAMRPESLQLRIPVEEIVAERDRLREQLERIQAQSPENRANRIADQIQISGIESARDLRSQENVFLVETRVSETLIRNIRFTTNDLEEQIVNCIAQNIFQQLRRQNANPSNE